VLPDESSPDATQGGPGAPGDRESSHLVLLLITVVLVVAGLVLLVAGYVGSSMAILYASIGCAAVAGVILIVYSRLNRRRQVALAGVAASETEAGTAEAVEAAGPDDAAGSAEGSLPAEAGLAGPAGDQPGEKPDPG
jgi:hypothetical protein